MFYAGINSTCKLYPTSMESNALMDHSLLEVDVKPLTLSNSNSLESIVQSFHKTISNDQTYFVANPLESTSHCEFPNSLVTSPSDDSQSNNAFTNQLSFVSGFPLRTNPTFMYHHYPIDDKSTISLNQTLPSMSMFGNGVALTSIKLEQNSSLSSNSQE